MSMGESVVSSATGQAGTGVTPVKGNKYVSLHPDRLLRDERSCAEVIKLSYASNINYSEAIIGLRNRALWWEGMPFLLSDGQRVQHHQD